MFEKNKKDRRKTALMKEWNCIIEKEKKMILAAEWKAAQEKRDREKETGSDKRTGKRILTDWKKTMEEKIPAKVYDNLQAAFGKAFALIFEKGEVLIEKTYNKDGILKDFAVWDYAVDVKGTRKELKNIRRNSDAAEFVNTAVSAVEGIGLGLLGVGLPDIVIFTGILLKGIYETALHYGFDYEKPEEKLLILKMMEASMLDGQELLKADAEVDEWIMKGIPEQGTYQGCSKEVRMTLAVRKQIQKTADVFALDMLFLRFVQGLPIIGIVGGAANPVYYKKVMKYVRLKYHKRYLWRKLQPISNE